MTSLRDRFQRVQLVFADEAPHADPRAPGIVGVQRQGRVITVLTRDRGALLEEARSLAPASADACRTAPRKLGRRDF